MDALTADARIVVVNGGTGVSRRDTTYDTLAAMLEKTLPGFGELFRMLSYEQVGSAAMLSRATAGTYRGSVVVSIPGSPKAVALAWEKLIEPELAISPGRSGADAARVGRPRRDGGAVDWDRWRP